MSWQMLHQTWPQLLEWVTGIAGFLFLTFKKQIQDGLISSGKKLWAYWFPGHIARRVTEKEMQEILGAGLEGVETLLYLLLKEYQADRVTITEYEGQDDGSALATCVVEVRQAQMKSVRNLKQTPISAALYSEIQRVAGLPGKMLYVPDARVAESAALRAALPASEVWSAYYQAMLSQAEPPFERLLAVSWHIEHTLTDAQQGQLHLSGLACATVLRLMSQMKKTPEA